MYEIIKSLRVNGDDCTMWRGKDAEGRAVYVCTTRHAGGYAPQSGGQYSQKSAREQYILEKREAANL